MDSDQRGGWGPLAEPVHPDRLIQPDDPPWRENAWLAFYDRPQGVYGVTHVTTSPNAGGLRSRCSLVADGWEAEIIEAVAPMEFSSPSISLDLAGHIVAKGADLAVDVTLVPRHHACDYSQSQVLPGLEGNEPLQHFQQTGTATGSVSSCPSVSPRRRPPSAPTTTSPRSAPPTEPSGSGPSNRESCADSGNEWNTDRLCGGMTGR